MRIALVFLFIFWLLPQATASNSGVDRQTLQRELNTLKVKAKAKEKKAAQIESSCSDPQSLCALELLELRATLKDLENEIKKLAATLGVDPSADSGSQAKAEAEKAQETTSNNQVKTEAEKAHESVLKKTKKQKRLQRLASIISAGVGVYMLKKQCSPKATPPVMIGCILGPLALAQAIISYKKANELGKVVKQFSGSSPEEPGSDTLSENTEDPDKADVPKVNDTPVSDIPFPCPGDLSKSCTLNSQGTQIETPDGSPPTNISSLTALIPNAESTKKAVDEALAEQAKLLEEAEELEPGFDPLSGVPVRKRGPASLASTSGSNSPISADVADAEEEVEWVDEEETPSNDALYEQFTGTAASQADGSGDGEYSGGLSDDDEVDVDAEVQKLLNQFAGKRKKAVVKAKKPLSFGKNDKISRASENIFSVIRRRYQDLRNRGEFIEGPTSRRSTNRRGKRK